ncbi:DUF4280 domain-containing protein [Chryseobacterium bernardetii]|uniref:DUF4280 domain-containing protein n=1 Tax=Chryseobacterium bernardetii TaxID=1241978 RepID=A0A3G6T6V7_9FLAO|nr:DUF4280 domain-containing protein [Chryseobacterium bernardetii]AZB25035.1 DUF4280 domain-containing protein [Chryseobacterium bernardetii]
MAVSYIPQDKVFAVCTYQLSSDPQKFSLSRKKADVYYQNTKQPLLTVDDKNIMVEFTCKSPANLAGTLLAFGAGLIVGALLLSNPLGWVALAAGGVLLASGVVAAVVAANHKCTDPLNGGQWFLAHNSVKINGASAITRSSILKCKKDGILTPFFDEASAKAAASSIATKNKWELGINVVASFGAGFFLPSAFAGFGTASVGMKVWMTVGRFGVGFLAFSSINYGLRGGIRWGHEHNGDLKDNITYDNMNNHKENIIDPKTGKAEETDIDENKYWGAPAKPDDFTQDSEDLIKVEKNGGKYNITILSKVTNVVTSYSIYADNRDLMRQLDKLEGLSRPVLRNNPLAKELLNDLNSGKYPEWKNSIRFYNNGRMTPSMVDDGRTVIAENLKSSLGSFKSNSIQGGLFLIPFIGTIFSEEARVALAEGMANDMSAEPNGSTVVANTSVD